MGVAVRITESGQAHNGYCSLFGVTINKADSSDTIVSLRDGLDENGTILWEFWGTDKGCFAKNFEPILLFESGIYVEITGAVYSVMIECS